MPILTPQAKYFNTYRQLLRIIFYFALEYNELKRQGGSYRVI